MFAHGRAAGRAAAPPRAALRWLDRHIPFMGNHPARFDVKGRISVPAAFRAALRAASSDGGAPMILRPSHLFPCVEGWPAAAFDELAAKLERMDLFGQDHNDLSLTIYGDAQSLEPDKEGRVILSADLVAHANLGQCVLFLCQGRMFQIWEPEAGRRRIAEARAASAARGLTLPAPRP